MKGITGVVGVLVFAAVLLAAGPAIAQTTFVFGDQGEPVSLDPAIITDGISNRITRQIYEGLVKYKGATTEVIPALAEKWEVSKDGTVWTFTLHKGVKFHDGNPFDAAAVVWNFDRWRLSKHPQHENQIKAGQTFRVLRGPVRRLRRQEHHHQGRGRQPADRPDHAEEPAGAVPRQPGDVRLRHCQPEGRREARAEFREEPGGHRPLQVRRVEGGAGGHPGGEQGLLGQGPRAQGPAGGHPQHQGQLPAAGGPEGG